MAKNLLVAEEISSVLNPIAYQGRIEATEALPIHCAAVGGSYAVMFNGTLTTLFSMPRFDRLKLTPAFFAADKGLSVQVYTHRQVDGKTLSYCALSSKIEYRYTYPILDSFLNAFKFGFRRIELTRFQAATNAAYASTRAFSAPLEKAGFFSELVGFSTLTNVFAPIRFRNGLPEYEVPINVNLSYFILSGGRFCTALEFPSLQSIRRNGLFMPEKGVEYLACTTVNYPTKAEGDYYRKEIQEYESLISNFKTKRDGDSFMTQTIEPEMLLDATRGMVLLRNYVFLISEDAMQLRKSAESYLRDLHAASMSVNTCIVRAKDAFCQIHPGQARFIPGGSRAEFSVVPRIVEAFHK